VGLQTVSRKVSAAVLTTTLSCSRVTETKVEFDWAPAEATKGSRTARENTAKEIAWHIDIAFPRNYAKRSRS
jgi:hypothetical protein